MWMLEEKEKLVSGKRHAMDDDFSFTKLFQKREIQKNELEQKNTN